jgi:CheY-like chemotaxis protein
MAEISPATLIFIVEDEFLIALDIQAMVQQLGGAVELASNLERALSFARSGQIGAALLDINLSGTRSFAVATLLKSRSIPFAFLTGYDAEMVPEEFANTPVLKKPFSRVDLALLLAKLTATGSP